jgi:glutathione S-transferase
MKRYFGVGASEAKLIRQGNDNINLHMECIGWLTGRRNWLAGLFNDKYCAAAHFSCVDYIGHVPWANRYPEV